MGQKMEFWSFWGHFWPLWPPGLKDQIFPRVKSNQNRCISMLSNLLEVSKKFNGKNMGQILQFWPFWGIFDPFDPPELKINSFPGPRVPSICFYQCCLMFWRVSQRSDGLINIYGAKIAILVIFWGIFDPFDPPNAQKSDFSQGQE